MAGPSLESLAEELRAVQTELRYLRDRQEILDTLNRYMRAIDRHDYELMCEEVFEEGAPLDMDMVVLTPRAIRTFHGPRCEEIFRTHVHLITNHLCEIDGDTAHCESYVEVCTVSK